MTSLQDLSTVVQMSPIVVAEPKPIVNLAPQIPITKKGLSNPNADVRKVDLGRSYWKRWLDSNGFIYLYTNRTARFQGRSYDENEKGQQVIECLTVLYWDLTTLCE